MRDAPSRRWDVGVDVGGTFVDLVARPIGTAGPVRSGKRLRAFDDPAQAVVEALASFLRIEGIEPGEVARLRHGTTIATNAILERRERPVALFTTRGFADVLTLGRQNRRDLDAPYAPPVPPGLCPDALRFELPERIDARGDVVAPLTPDDLGAAIERFAAALEPGRELPAVAVCLLFAPLNPVHEQAVAAALRARWPDLHLSLSHAVDPGLREFERTLATVLDAYIRPAVAGYLGRLGRLVAGMDLPAPWIMRSSGGLAPIGAASAAPAALAMSGPAAAAIAVREVACREGGAAPAIGLDVGGTTTDVSFIVDGAVRTASALTLDGLDLRVPSADILSVAIGGGSILAMAGGLLRVGPHSMGSRPGPACYGRGGRLPTLTDAALVAGLLPTRLAGLRLDRDTASAALTGSFGIAAEDAPEAAWSAVKVAEAALAEAIRRKAFACGIDPRAAVLVAAGGGGAMHAAEVADRIGAVTVRVPAAAGVLAAVGLLHAGLCEQRQRPIGRPLAVGTLRFAAVYAEEDAAALRNTLTEWSSDRAGADVRHELDLAYEGQGDGLTVPFFPARDEAKDLAARFGDRHRQLRGQALDASCRVLALRTIAAAPLDGLARENPPDAACAGSLPAPPACRTLAGPGLGPCPAWPRETLPAGARLAGPALIDAPDTTIWVPPGWRCVVEADASLLLRAEPSR